MARWNRKTLGKYHHGYKVCYTGPTPEAAVKSAKEALEGNPNKALRTMSKPEKLENGQYRVIIT
jgi:hypothetical protein